MSTENALVTLLREGVSVQESSVDSKRDLEDALRSACNDFIEHTSQSLARDVLNLSVQCRSHEDATEQAFMNAELIMGMLQQTSEHIETALLQGVMSQMGLYLDNPATQSILLKPVSRKIIRSLDEVRKVIQGGKEGVNGWDVDNKKTTLAVMDKMETTVKQAGKGK